MPSLCELVKASSIWHITPPPSHGNPGLPQWLSGKESTYNAGAAGDMGLIPVSGRSPAGGHGNPRQLFLSGESHGQGSLAGYSPWGCKESDTSEAT